MIHLEAFSGLEMPILADFFHFSMRSHHVCMERKFSGNDSFGNHRNPKQSSRLRMPLSSGWERPFRRKASLMWILMPRGRSHVAGKRTVASLVLQWAIEDGGQVKLPSAVIVTDCEIGSEMRLLWAVSCFIQAEDSVIITARRGVTSLQSCKHGSWKLCLTSNLPINDNHM